MNSSIKRYYPFCLALFLFQVIGYNAITLAILVLSFIPITSAEEMLVKLKTIPNYFFFLMFSITVGLYFALANGIQSWNIPYWGQFYFFSFALMAVKDKQKAFFVIKYCAYAILAADIFTNLALLAGLEVPWAALPDLRTGESMVRYGGVNNNTLYSGSITFISICYFLQEDTKKLWLKYAILLTMAFNIILSGSYRYFIICAAIMGLYFFRLYKHRLMLFTSYIASIIIVYFATKITMFLSTSNFLRFLIWQHFMKEIMKSPWLGHGFFNMHLENIPEFSFYNLVSHGVTESCILLLGYSFGLPILTFFIVTIAITLYRFKNFQKYGTELAIFLGLSLDLFWGGSFDNSLSLSVLTLSIYLINQKVALVEKKQEETVYGL